MFELNESPLLECLLTVSQVLHATPTLHQTLLNTRKLLKPGGYLFLQELCPGAPLLLRLLLPS